MTTNTHHPDAATSGPVLTPVRIGDWVIDQIADTIGAAVPESGGALLGLPHLDWITGYLHDSAATTTATRYANSTTLLDAVAAAETHGHARFAGIIHSHPAAVSEPSVDDQREYGRTLALTPHLTGYIAPIVTHDVDAPPQPHQIVYGPIRISFYRATAASPGCTVQQARPVVVPIGRALAAAGIPMNTVPTPTLIAGALMLAVTGDVPGVGTATILFGPDFPTTAPIIVPDAPNAGPLPLAWNPADPPVQRLAAALHRTAPLSGPRRTSSDGSPGAPLFARTGGLLSTTLAERRVLIAGAGSVGSYLAETIARSGVRRFTIVDPGRVRPENLGRSSYRTDDIGTWKSDATAGLIGAINPDANTDTIATAVNDLPPDRLASLVTAADLVIGATDDPAAQILLGHHAYHAGKTALFPGLYRRAAGGEVVIVTPGTPCLGCATGGVRTADGPQQRVDYGTGRLVAEPGLVADIHHVASAAAKLALGLLHPDGDETSVAVFARRAVADGSTYVTFACEADYWLHGQLLADAPGQYAYQALWLTPQSRPDCPVCGDPQNRTAPAARTEPDLAKLRALPAD